MRAYFKYLIIGWSIVSVILIFFLYKGFRGNFITERFVIYQPKLVMGDSEEEIFEKTIFEIYLERLGQKIKKRYSQYRDIEDTELGRLIYNLNYAPIIKNNMLMNKLMTIRV